MVKKNEYCREELESFKEMFSMTTNHLKNIQKELKQKNESIAQSVAYAQKIQEQMVPAIEVNGCSLKDIYYYLKQRDSIGGDFIYISENEEWILFGLMDCTGHGIPGALLSMMGYNFLNDIVINDKYYMPNKILEELDQRFRNYFSLNKSTEPLQDGMDGIICGFHKQKKILYYSMAGRPLWYKQDNLWKKHRPDRNSIGGLRKSNFTLHELNLKNGLEFFIFSDGLSDQFGGPKNKKFLAKRIMDHLKSMQHYSLSEKGEKLSATIENWKQDYEQTDDISFLSVLL